jgi:hypothetical protein
LTSTAKGANFTGGSQLHLQVHGVGMFFLPPVFDTEQHGYGPMTFKRLGMRQRPSPHRYLLPPGYADWPVGHVKVGRRWPDYPSFWWGLDQDLMTGLSHMSRCGGSPRPPLLKTTPTFWGVRPPQPSSTPVLDHPLLDGSQFLPSPLSSTGSTLVDAGPCRCYFFVHLSAAFGRSMMRGGSNVHLCQYLAEGLVLAKKVLIFSCNIYGIGTPFRGGGRQ